MNWILFSHFGELIKKLPKNAQKIQTRSFSLISQRIAGENNRIISNGKLITSKNQNEHQNKRNNQQMAAPQFYN